MDTVFTDVKVTGNLTVLGNIISGDASGDSQTISGDLTIGDDLTVTDDAAVGGDLAVTGNGTVGGTLGVTGLLTATAGVAGGIKLPVVAATEDGAIAIPASGASIVFLGGTGARAMTLAAPSSQDGTLLIIVGQTAEAHTVTVTAGFNGGGSGADVATFGAAGDSLMLVARGTNWYVISNEGVTIA